MHDLFYYRTKSEIETHRRIKLSMAAYAYEILNRPIIDDHMFDSEAKKVDLNISTNRPDLDNWFRENFQPDTGQWIYKHPELDKIASLCNRFIPT